MVLSDKQLRLVQAGALILQEHMFLSLNQSLAIINSAMSSEIHHYDMEMDEVDSQDAEFRKKFIRGVVIRIRKKIRQNSGVSDAKVKKGIDEFVKVIEDIWNN